jgi:arylsulfatase A-like enzyme
VLVDDAGFGSSSVFGGPCNTPTFERLASGGLRYTRFHTTALCAPTRAALPTGRNHHSVGMGSITETATSAPGQSSVRPNTKAPLAEVLQLNGYSTGQFGKCHEVPQWQTSPMGPFGMWPTGSGFEYFYGFIGGEDNQWNPALYEGTTPIEPPGTPDEGYHLTEDLADKAIAWVRQQKALMPDKPFFMYFAPGATHAPHHVPADRIAKYKGAFDGGWDKQREATFARQKELGVIPPDAELTKRLELLASELDRTWPDAAASLREGMGDTLTLMRLGIDGQLAKTLCSTNPCESMIEIVRYTQRNVKRWQAGDMRKRWTAAGMLVAEQQFRRIVGYRHLAKLVIAIERHAVLAAEKNRARQDTREPVTV